MDGVFITYIFLLLLIALLVMVAERIKISYPIVLVVGGLALSLIPRFQAVEIDPELIFLIFLPPVLYEASWQTSWKDFWKWRRIIFSYAFPIVIITSCVVAFVSSSIIPGFTLALGFLLGGIVSPPDAVSATSIMRNVQVPKRISAIIEGESLLNDASSIVVFRFALMAVITGSFVFEQAAANFFIVIVMGAVIGLAVALIFYGLHRWLPTTPTIDLALSIVTPYLMYIAAEYFHFSGVLAVVTGGLFLSQQRQTILSPLSRLQGVNVWSMIGFLLNGLIFMLIGLQMPIVTQQMGDVSLSAAIKYSLIITAVLIISRMIIALGTSVFTTYISRFITTADPNPGFKAPVIIGLSGMRGVVSLAAALSIPLYINGGLPFPHRNLILFITFSVILMTLVLQGLALPFVIKKMNLKDPDYKVPEAEQEMLLQKKLSACALEKMETRFKEKMESNVMLKAFRQRLQNKFLLLTNIDKSMNQDNGDNNEAIEYEEVRKQIIEAQRELLFKTNKDDGISDEVIKKHLLLLDHEEEQLKNEVKLFFGTDE